MTGTSNYAPPKISIWNKPNGGEFASLKRPVAAPTHEKELLGI
jgi:GST-like protein